MTPSAPLPHRCRRPACRSRKLLTWLVLLSGPAVFAADGDITTLVNNGATSNRVDVVFMGDGYTASDTTAYVSHVDSMVNYLFTPNYLADPLPRTRSFLMCTACR